MQRMNGLQKKIRENNGTLAAVSWAPAIFCTLLLMQGCSWGLEPRAATVQEEIDNAVEHGLDGVVVCVNQAGESKVYTAGWSNRENRVPAHPDALFKIASISKLYIAAAAAKLVSGGHLRLEVTLADYLPDLRGRIENAGEITLKMMLQHRSGIPNFTDQSGYSWGHPPTGNKEILSLVLDKPAEFEPGKKYRYSNTNYLLIGKILDNTLGYSHQQYIRHKILLPLVLRNTYGLLGEADANDVMSGYCVGCEGDMKLVDFVQPGGSMVATAADVGIFLRALFDGSLLTSDEQAIYSSIYNYEHTGLLPGYQSIARYHQDIDAVVVQFVNTSGGHLWAKSEKVYSRIIKILRKQQH